jgi:tRNA threonylcarbamoyladenosine biosynthesis protein TsaE
VDSERVKIATASPAETREIGRVLGANTGPGQVLALRGELGAGKTTLTQGVLWGLGGTEYARSPTFVLVTQYEARIPLYHIDLYRIGSSADALELGLDEYFYGDGVCVVEWPDRAPEAIPNDRLDIEIVAVDDSTRKLTLSTASEDHRRLLEAIYPLSVAVES